MKPIKTFKVYNEASLYNGVKSIDWSEYITNHQSFVIDATVFSDQFNHSQFVALKSKDAIVDQFKEETGNRPNIDKDYPDLRINIHIQQDLCTVSLDSSGASLHHRGYRTATNIAPINEVLAAGILLLSGWKGQSHFIDPMCGSGTFLVEAAMIACNIPPNINRKEFAFSINRRDAFSFSFNIKCKIIIIEMMRIFQHTTNKLIQSNASTVLFNTNNH